MKKKENSFVIELRGKGLDINITNSYKVLYIYKNNVVARIPPNRVEIFTVSYLKNSSYLFWKPTIYFKDFKKFFNEYKMQYVGPNDFPLRQVIVKNSEREEFKRLFKELKDLDEHEQTLTQLFKDTEHFISNQRFIQRRQEAIDSQTRQKEEHEDLNKKLAKSILKNKILCEENGWLSEEDLDKVEGVMRSIESLGY